MIIRKLCNMPYAQAQIREYRKSEGCKRNYDILQSYQTDVLMIDYDKCTVTCYGLYSRTTRKHISSFMREKGLDYSIAKKCYEENADYNFLDRKYIRAGA